MFTLSFIVCLFVSCYGVSVRILDHPPVVFELNKGKVITCAAQIFQPPLTYRWMLVQSPANYTFPNSNSSKMTITFDRVQNGYLLCQAKGKFDKMFFNSTLVPFYVNAGSTKKVYITNSSPIHFTVKSPKTLTCKTEGFRKPISYQWINVTNHAVLSTTGFPDASFTFNQPVRDGALQCAARGPDDQNYITSKSVQYYVSPDSTKKVYITNSSPIHFKVNRSKTLTCKAEGFKKPITYQWINVTNHAVLSTSGYADASFTFHQRVRDGALQCAARGPDDQNYIPSKNVKYYVSAQMKLEYNVFLMLFLITLGIIS